MDGDLTSEVKFGGNSPLDTLHGRQDIAAFFAPRGKGGVLLGGVKSG